MAESLKQWQLKEIQSVDRFTYYFCCLINCESWKSNNCNPGGGGGGVLGILSDGDDRRIFLGLKLSIPGFFWVRKFGKYFLG